VKWPPAWELVNSKSECEEKTVCCSYSLKLRYQETTSGDEQTENTSMCVIVICEV
jgi:hypothetical protein